MARSSSITMPSMVGILGRAPVVDEKVSCFFTGRPARSGAMPVLFLLSGSKMGFSPRSGALEALRDALYKYTTTTIDTTTTTTTRCPNKREIWYPCQISRLSGQKCGNTAPKTVKISNFGHKFVPRGRLVCNIVR